MSLRDLEKKIYEKRGDRPSSTESAEREEDNDVKRSGKPQVSGKWADEENAARDEGPDFLSRVARRILWALAGVLAIAFITGGYFIYQFFSTKDVAFNITAPNQVSLGAPFNLKVSIKNDSAKVLKDARLVMQIPDGAVFVGKASDQDIENLPIGDLGIGSFSEENFQIMFVSGTSVTKEFQAVVSYNPETLGAARFEKRISADVAVGEPVVGLNIVLPSKVLSGDNFNMGIKYRNLSDSDLSNLQLKINYPQQFTFRSANLSPLIPSDTWSLGNLLKGSEGELDVSGMVAGKDNSFFPFDVQISTEIMGERYVISSASVNLAVAASPLTMNIVVNGDSNLPVVSEGDKLNYRINYKNTTDVPLQNLVIKAQLAGVLYNLSSLQTGGFFSSLDNTITWNAANTPALRLLQSNAEGSVDFTINVVSDFIPRRLSDKNFSLKVRGSIESPTVPSYLSADKTAGFADMETKVVGKTTVNAEAIFRETASGFVNAGSLPPKVNKPTQYTIHWLISDYITDVSNITVSANLQGGVSWTGKVTSNIASKPVYDPNTQSVMWIIDHAVAGRGILNPPIEAVFQVEVTPSILDVGNFKKILSQTTLKAHDDFVNADITWVDNELTTELAHDPTVSKNDGIVGN